MKHLVMVKWNETVADKKAMAEEVLDLFKKAQAENEEIGEIELATLNPGFDNKLFNTSRQSFNDSNLLPS